jgi:hypothetical protein
MDRAKRSYIASAIAQANYPHWWDVVLRCTPRDARSAEWEEMARQALQHAEWAGNPWFLADPLGTITVDLPDLEEEKENEQFGDPSD